jgi:hypothetical protein
MKTNVVMVRRMGDFDVHQRTKDSMFNANSLLKQWNDSQGLKRGKEVNDFLKLDKTKEFVCALELDYNDTTRKIVVSSQGKNGGTWLDPLLFIDFAMWLNPTFKVQVLKFVYDELLKQRNNAGDNYLSLSASGTKLRGYDFVEVAKAMQWIIFGKTGKQMRQSATQEQLVGLNELQSKLSFAIDMDYIKTYPQLISELRKIYNLKNKKF